MKNKIELGVYYFKERNLQEYFIEVLRWWYIVEIIIERKREIRKNNCFDKL